ncbi:MAG: hypothetical protein A2X86_09805 [Bdellovibrionales bacterium GWA2_49_15]|nr:MAG: hypothetical protein A2X86_09805 [Bdellovibrionales bacterium GWA2_49_15]HAZ13077.1 hypothetical protein [Bdellovibrionales bacterium]
MSFLFSLIIGVLFVTINLGPVSAQDAGGADNYDPNQVRNDDFRYQPKTVALSKVERDKKLDEIVDKFEELRLREEALVAKKANLAKANDKDGLEDLEDDFKDLADDRAKIDKEMASLRN